MSAATIAAVLLATLAAGCASTADGDRVNPQELTYEDGFKRFPKALHPKAFTAAWRGWQDAQADAAERNFDSTLTEAAKWAHNDRMALNLQIDANPGQWL